MTILIAKTEADYNTLPETRKLLLNYIKLFIQEYGYAPTIREMKTGASISSTSVVYYHLNKLVKAGFLEKAKAISRGLRVPDCLPQVAMPTHMPVPILAHPILPAEGYLPRTEQVYEVPVRWLVGTQLGEVYALQIDTHLMYDAMVSAGDVMVLQRQPWIEAGGTALVQMPNHEFRIRRVYEEGDEVRLVPLLSVIQPLRCPRASIQVVGKVLGLLRQF